MGRMAGPAAGLATALAAALLLLAACSEPAPKVGEIGAVEGFLGGIVTEEPRAALVARDALSAGGTAADAATAAYFAMTVTYPVAVGLGGGGLCLYYDHSGNKAEALEFRALTPGGGGAVAMPGALRGMALLHSRYGRLPWGQLVAPGEKLARFGHHISRALAKRLAPQAGKLRRDAMAAGIFLHPDGTPLGEAENLVQVELASVLARIRTRGLSDFYSAEMGRHWLAASTSHGGKATIGDLRGYRAFWQETDRLSVGNEILYFPKLSQAEGPAFKLVALLNAKPLAAAAGKVFGQASVAMTHDRGETGLVVGDSFGSAAACVFQMNDAFGSGAMAPNMGVFLAPSIARGMAGAANWPGHPLPLLGANENVRQVFFAASGTGGPLGAASAAALSRAVMIEGKTLEQIMSANKSAGLDRPDRVQALWCPKGIRDGASSCQFATDARAHGLAVFDQF
ncbi:MAG: gamma-glutamyltransferase [Alphaproteobacteria bacterium]|nr:gamma-glutamyltransferase [Alphaproteobacteria bacterium]MDP6253755.1 gamma-glutamyltransferase [Alphaproteobacteria bacterium]MDP7055751.1 gamma-glutamyltransferase [Alphaproteobacteria bacterium]MDP7460575.1 gamma-glutamyltransferase [Alphaproteobacteria bacterium]HJM93059.1 gamma-glutamyltransferase [Alphaproteobacteria bacterium]|tara:strand:+ start:13151 stop:14515 length:1365 start_codon:yes stop_codon:yes gene_type:complete